jgi:hypothetical protein
MIKMVLILLLFMGVSARMVFKMFTKQVPWLQALEECKKLNAELAIVTQLSQLGRLKIKLEAHKNKNFWIGGAGNWSYIKWKNGKD